MRSLNSRSTHLPRAGGLHPPQMVGLRRPLHADYSGASSSSGITGERFTVSSTMDEVTSRTPATRSRRRMVKSDKRLDVAHDDVQQEVHLAGHGVAGEDLGPVDERAPEALDDLIGMLLELDLHDGLDGLARALRIDDRRVTLDEPRSLELRGCGARRASRINPPLGQVRYADAPVALQDIQDSSIGLVELHNWRI